MIVLPILLVTGLLLLAGYGVYVLVMGLIHPWHLLLFAVAPVAAVFVLAVAYHLACVLIDRLRKPKE